MPPEKPFVLHPSQELIAADTHRFRVLCNGRRWGKTTLAIEEMKGKMVSKANRVCYIAPTYQQARDICWEKLTKELRPATINVNESRLEIKIKNAQNTESICVLRGWESIETLRGQQFDFVVIDEVAMMRDFWTGWNNVISPTLTDTKGDVLFISTPKGFNHFYDLYNFQEKDPDFKSFHYTSYDNPNIPPEEIDRQRNSLPYDAFAQEFLADFKKTEGLVYKEFSRIKHVYNDGDLQGQQPKYILHPVETLVGVDFGFSNPCAVLTIQRDASDTFWVTKEFYETGHTDSEVAEYIAGVQPNRVYPDPAAPAAIQELRKKGLNVRQVVKGKDSIKHGIDTVREFLNAGKLRVHDSCLNLIMEFETYSYTDPKPDQNLNEKPDKWQDHALDALRYVLMTATKGNQVAHIHYAHQQVRGMGMPAMSSKDIPRAAHTHIPYL